MRFIVFGVGAVGGTVAAGLALAGEEVVGIARGRRLEAIRAHGVTLRSPGGTENAHFPCVASPAEIGLRDDDAILLVTKSQDTAAALAALRQAGAESQAIFCVQNGVANERAALRLFPNVHGVNVMLPAEYMAPGETVAFCSPNFGIFDIGRFPDGADSADEVAAAALTRARIAGFVAEDVMRFKYGKLLQNLGNIVEAALGGGTGAADLTAVLRDEGRMVLDRLGIAWQDVGPTDPRRETMRMGRVEGVERLGSSSTQSLARGAGSIETDYLNGEIVLLGRMNGIPTPANAYATRLAARLARDGSPPGSVPPADFAAGLGL